MDQVSCETGSIERQTVLLQKQPRQARPSAFPGEHLRLNKPTWDIISKPIKSLFSAARGTQANHHPAVCRKSIGAFRIAYSQSSAARYEQGPLWFFCRRDNICRTTTQARQRLWCQKRAVHLHARNTITLLARDCDRVRSLYGDVFKKAA
jgi:hypothetical protein